MKMFYGSFLEAIFGYLIKLGNDDSDMSTEILGNVCRSILHKSSSEMNRVSDGTELEQQ
jgi:hypothetical protein